MRLKLLLILCISWGVQAQDLSEILDSLTQSKKVKALQSKAFSDIAQNELELSYNTPEFSVNIAHAKDSTDDGMEYGISFSQNISHPFADKTKERARDSISASIKQELKHEIHLLTLNTSSLYHNACISKEVKQKASELFIEQSKRFSQLQNAYDLGEISRNNLLFNKLDLVKLKQNISAYERGYLVELSKLQESIDNLVIQNLSCSDLVEIKRDIKLSSIEKHNKMKNITHIKDSSQAFYNLYDSIFQSIGYELSYDKELDTDIFSFGVSIPLDSFGSQKEKQKAKYLHKSNFLESQKEVLKKEINNKSKSLQLKIETLYDEYVLLTDEILPLSKELLELSASALREGEGSAMEYLDASRSYSEKVLEVLEIKKNYYNELFELYKVADLELGE